MTSGSIIGRGRFDGKAKKHDLCLENSVTDSNLWSEIYLLI